MKAVVVGDFLLPANVLKKIFVGNEIEETVDEVQTINFKSESRGDIRKVWRILEDEGLDNMPCPDELYSAIENAEILAVHICPVPADLIKRASKLKVILSARGGLENIALEAARDRGIAVIHTPHHNANAVAEFTVGMMLAETRNIARSYGEMFNGVWQEYYPNSDYIPELKELTIAIVGFGHTGRLTAQKLKSFECNIIIADPFVSADDVIKMGFKPVALQEALETADIVSLHVRLTKDTREMIADKEFNLMKKGAYIVNSARSGLIKESSLVEALKSGHLKGAAIDVFDIEPLPQSSPLLKLKNLTFTNHRAGDTRNSYWGAPELLQVELLQYITNGTSRFLVKN